MPEPTATNWRFGDFELDSKAYELRRLGRPVKIERIPMDLLILLVRHRGDLVSREEIVDRLWGKETFVDGENSVNTAVRKVRLALRDSTANPAFVQTVSGKGYRFCAEVTTQAAKEDSPALGAGIAMPESKSPAAALPEDPEHALTPIAASASMDENASEASIPQGTSKLKVRTMVALAAGLVLVPVLYLSRTSFLGQQASSGQVTVALLPFENL
ncbi:MAG: winged helix-turn-helix domain-containing protein, partial [Bryobacteraceae bacterium]